MTVSEKAPYSYDIVGSFLRPQKLKDAREAFEAGRIGRDELIMIEDESIESLVNKLASLGYQAVTDGEFRRGWYHSDFLGALKGVRFSTYKMNLFGQETTVGSTVIEDRVRWNPDHPFLAHFKFLKALTDERGLTAKFDIPGPNIVLLDTITTDLDNCYNNDVATLAEDLVEVYRAAIKSFYDAGCRYLQIDDPIWVSVCDDSFKEKIAEAGFAVEGVKQLFAEMAEKMLEDRPKDMVITLHLCQGNMRSMKFYDATYEEITETIFNLPFDGYFMEYDDEKYCDFGLLDMLPAEKKVVLGIVSTRYSDLEDGDELIKRVNSALEHVDKEQVCVATQCGFASTAEGNIITEQAQWEKLALLKEIADTALA